ncbi:hypothetical protein Bca52824_003387 [Brassica carinata]|uniref:Uncharacterized protein n=1 Tax=Brassica carinata TaxID=52824 RepID=A0A8X7WML5_BRACI|nr:hypothetical protein Bca52824_003387 [Brassica carinata]
MSDIKQAEDAIARIKNSLGTSEDNSVALLIAYNWDESKIVNFWSFSSGAIISSLGLIHNPGVEIACELRQAPCGVCDRDTLCQRLGCLHSICCVCIEAHADTKIMNGEITIMCPIPCCGKMAASSLILSNLSLESSVIFKESLGSHFRASKAQVKSVFEHVGEPILARILRITCAIKGIALKLWRKKNSLLTSFLVVILFCHTFCEGSELSCAVQLGLANLYAAAFDMWGNIFKVYVSQSYP